MIRLRGSKKARVKVDDGRGQRPALQLGNEEPSTQGGELLSDFDSDEYEHNLRAERQRQNREALAERARLQREATTQRERERREKKKANLQRKYEEQELAERAETARLQEELAAALAARREEEQQQEEDCAMREHHERTRRDAREALLRVQAEVAHLTKPQRRPHSAPDGRALAVPGPGSAAADSIQAELEATLLRLAEMRESNSIEAAEAAGRGRAPLASQLRSRGAQLRAAAELVEGGQLDRAHALLGGLNATLPLHAPLTAPPAPVEATAPQPLGKSRGLRELELAFLTTRTAPPAAISAVELAAQMPRRADTRKDALYNEAAQRRDGARTLRSVLRVLRTHNASGVADAGDAAAAAQNEQLGSRLQRMFTDSQEASIVAAVPSATPLFAPAADARLSSTAARLAVSTATPRLVALSPLDGAATAQATMVAAVAKVEAEATANSARRAQAHSERLAAKAKQARWAANSLAASAADPAAVTSALHEAKAAEARAATAAREAKLVQAKMSEGMPDASHAQVDHLPAGDDEELRSLAFRRAQRYRQTAARMEKIISLLARGGNEEAMVRLESAIEQEESTACGLEIDGRLASSTSLRTAATAATAEPTTADEAAAMRLPEAGAGMEGARRAQMRLLTQASGGGLVPGEPFSQCGPHTSTIDAGMTHLAAIASELGKDASQELVADLAGFSRNLVQPILRGYPSTVTSMVKPPCEADGSGRDDSRTGPFSNPLTISFDARLPPASSASAAQAPTRHRRPFHNVPGGNGISELPAHLAAVEMQMGDLARRAHELPVGAASELVADVASFSCALMESISRGNAPQQWQAGREKLGPKDDTQALIDLEESQQDLLRTARPLAPLYGEMRERKSAKLTAAQIASEAGAFAGDAFDQVMLTSLPEHSAAQQANHEEVAQAELDALRTQVEEKAMHSKAARKLCNIQRVETAALRMKHLRLSQRFENWREVVGAWQGLRQVLEVVRHASVSRAFRRWGWGAVERRHLRNAFARMGLPALAGAFATWRRIAVAHAKQKVLEGAELKYQEELRVRLARSHDDSEQALAEREAEAQRLRSELEEKLTLKAQEALGAKAAQGLGNQTRQEQAARRMQQLRLAHGFSHWLDGVVERQALSNATTQLLIPCLERARRKWLVMSTQCHRLRTCAPMLATAFLKWRQVAVADATQNAIHRAVQTCEQQVQERLSQAHMASACELAGRDAEAERLRRSLTKHLADREYEANLAETRALRQQQERAMHQIVHGSLARGLNAWRIAAEQKQRMCRAAMSLHAVGSSGAFRWWRKTTRADSLQRARDERLAKERRHEDKVRQRLQFAEAATNNQLARMRVSAMLDNAILVQDLEVDEQQRATERAAKLRELREHVLRRLLMSTAALAMEQWESAANAQRCARVLLALVCRFQRSQAVRRWREEARLQTHRGAINHLVRRCGNELRELEARLRSEQEAGMLALERALAESEAVAVQVAADSSSALKDSETKHQAQLAVTTKQSSDAQRELQVQALRRLQRWSYAKAMDRWCEHVAGRRRRNLPLSKLVQGRMLLPGRFRRWKKEAEFARRWAALRAQLRAKQKNLDELEERLRRDAVIHQKALDDEAVEREGVRLKKADSEREAAAEREKRLRTQLVRVENTSLEVRGLLQQQALRRLVRWGFAKALQRWRVMVASRKRILKWKMPQDEVPASVVRRVRLPAAFRRWRQEAELAKRKQPWREYLAAKRMKLEQLEERLHADAARNAKRIEERRVEREAEIARKQQESRAREQRLVEKLDEEGQALRSAQRLLRVVALRPLLRRRPGRGGADVLGATAAEATAFRRWCETAATKRTAASGTDQHLARQIRLPPAFRRWRQELMRRRRRAAVSEHLSEKQRELNKLGDELRVASEQRQHALEQQAARQRDEIGELLQLRDRELNQLRSSLELSQLQIARANATAALRQLLRHGVKRAWARWEAKLTGKLTEAQCQHIERHVRLPRPFRKVKQYAKYCRRRDAFRRCLDQERDLRTQQEERLRTAKASMQRELDELQAQADTQRRTLEASLATREHSAQDALYRAFERQREQAVHFFLQRRLAKGWRIWRDTVRRRRQQLDHKLMLRGGQRMRSPALASAFRTWRMLCEEAVLRNGAIAAAAAILRAQAEAEVRINAEREVAAAMLEEEQALAERAQLVLSKSLERHEAGTRVKCEEQIYAQREATMRRFMRDRLSRGWEQWLHSCRARLAAVAMLPGAMELSMHVGFRRWRTWWLDRLRALAARERMHGKQTQLDLEEEKAALAEALHRERANEQELQDERLARDQDRADLEAQFAQMAEAHMAEMDKEVRRRLDSVIRGWHHNKLVRSWRTWIGNHAQFDKMQAQVQRAATQLLARAVVGAFSMWRSQYLKGLHQQERSAIETTMERAQQQREKYAQQALRKADAAERARQELEEELEAEREQNRFNQRALRRKMRGRTASPAPVRESGRGHRLSDGFGLRTGRGDDADGDEEVNDDGECRGSARRIVSLERRLHNMSQRSAEEVHELQEQLAWHTSAQQEAHAEQLRQLSNDLRTLREERLAATSPPVVEIAGRATAHQRLAHLETENMALVERLRTDAIGSAAQRLCALEQRLTDALQEESRTSPQTAEETRALQAQVDSVVKRLADMRELAELPTRGVLALTPERERLRDGLNQLDGLLSEIRQQGACESKEVRNGLRALGAEINALRAIRFADAAPGPTTRPAAPQTPPNGRSSTRAGHAAPLQVELADGEDVGQTLELLQKHMGSIVRLLSDSDGHPDSDEVVGWLAAIAECLAMAVRHHDAADACLTTERSEAECKTMRNIFAGKLERRDPDGQLARRDAAHAQAMGALERTLQEKDDEAKLQRQERAKHHLTQFGLRAGLNTWHQVVGERRRLCSAAALIGQAALLTAFREWCASSLLAARRKEIEASEASHKRQMHEKLAIARHGSDVERHRREAATDQRQLQLEDGLAERVRQAKGAEEAIVRVAWCRQEYIARRLVNLQVARAFGGWAERARELRLRQATTQAWFAFGSPLEKRVLRVWRGYVTEKRFLRNAVLCMHPPALASAFNQWCEVARGRREAAKRKTADEDFEKRLQQQLAARETTLQLEKAGLEEQLEQREQAAAAAAKDLLAKQRQEQAARRIIQLGLARAFRGWGEMTDEQKCFKRAALSLRNPGLAAAFNCWKAAMQVRWQLRKTAVRMRSLQVAIAFRSWRRAAEMCSKQMAKQRICKDFEERLREHIELFRRESEQDLAECAAEAARQRLRLEERLAKSESAQQEAERRHASVVRHRQEEAAQRMMYAELANAFGVWQHYADERRAFVHIQARMRSPALSAAWHQWQRVAAGETARKLKEDLEREHEVELRGRLALERGEMERRLIARDAAAEKQRRALEKKLEETERKLADVRQGQAASAAEHRQRQSAQRMRQMGLVKAFSCWSTNVETRRRMRNAVASMRCPALAASFAEWRRAATFVRRHENLEALQVEHAQHARQRLALVRSESGMQLARLQSQLDEAHERAEKVQAERELAQRKLQVQAARRMKQMRIAHAFFSWLGTAGQRRTRIHAQEHMHSRCKPLLIVAAFREWKAQAARARRQREQDLRESLFERRLRERLAQARSSTERELAERDALTDNQRRELQSQVAEWERLLVAEKAQRETHALRQLEQFAWRATHRILARGFDAWRCMAAGVQQPTHVCSPMLATAFAQWRRYWRAIIRQDAHVKQELVERRFEQLLRSASEQSERVLATRNKEARAERRTLEEALKANRRATDEARAALDCATKRHHESMQLACTESERALAARDEVSSAERCALAERLELAEQAAADAEVVLDRARDQHKQQLAQSASARLLVCNGADSGRHAMQQRLEEAERAANVAHTALMRMSTQHERARARCDSKKDAAMHREEAAAERRALQQRLGAAGRDDFSRPGRDAADQERELEARDAAALAQHRHLERRLEANDLQMRAAALEARGVRRCASLPLLLGDPQRPREDVEVDHCPSRGSIDMTPPPRLMPPRCVHPPRSVAVEQEEGERGDALAAQLLDLSIQLEKIERQRAVKDVQTSNSANEELIAARERLDEHLAVVQRQQEDDSANRLQRLEAALQEAAREASAQPMLSDGSVAELVEDLKKQVQEARAQQTSELAELQSSLQARVAQSMGSATSHLAAQLAQVQAALADLQTASERALAGRDDVSERERDALVQAAERERRIYQEGLEANRRAADEARAALDRARREQMEAAAPVSALDSQVIELRRQLQQLCDAQQRGGGEAADWASRAAAKNAEARERQWLEHQLEAQAEAARKAQQDVDGQQRELMNRINLLEERKTSEAARAESAANLRAASADDALKTLNEHAAVQADRQNQLELQIRAISLAKEDRVAQGQEKLLMDMRAEQSASQAKFDELKELLMKIQIEAGGGGGKAGADRQGSDSGKDDRKGRSDRSESDEKEADELPAPPPEPDEVAPEPEEPDEAPLPPPPVETSARRQTGESGRARFEEMLDNKSLYSEEELLGEALGLFTDGAW